MLSPLRAQSDFNAVAASTLFDAVVIGAGFGGLATALRLAELGKRVALLETLAYPGGCASSFTRRGYTFESGATLFSGFDPGELFARWIDAHKMDVKFEPIDVPVEIRAPGMVLPIARERSQFLRALCALAPSDAPKIAAFFAEQEQVAGALWSLFRDPSLLPPFDFRGLLVHATRTPAYLPILRHVGKPLWKAVRRHDLHTCVPLRIFLECVCQITVQASAQVAEAPFAMAAMDYYFRGTGHVHGGIGKLAWGMARAFEELGGCLLMTTQAHKIDVEHNQYVVTTRRGPLRTKYVVCNLLPQAAAQLLTDVAETQPTLSKMHKKLESGWGAAMLYRVIPAGALTCAHAHHLELVGDSAEPMVEGNHVFCSISAVDETARVKAAGERTVTISTHVPMNDYVHLTGAEQGVMIARIQQRMRDTIAARAPELADALVLEMTGSPRTFERFTGRSLGLVGGVPRTYGLHNYAHILPTRIAPQLYMCGDTCFPGQSTLGVALGGVKVAEAVAADL